MATRATLGIHPEYDAIRPGATWALTEVLPGGAAPFGLVVCCRTKAPSWRVLQAYQSQITRVCLDLLVKVAHCSSGCELSKPCGKTKTSRIKSVSGVGTRTRCIAKLDLITAILTHLWLVVDSQDNLGDTGKLERLH